MIELLEAPDHVLAARLTGTLTGQDYDRLIQDIEARLARHRRIAVYVDMTGFTDLTAEALGKDLRYFFAKLDQLDRFGRYAAVTDKLWIKALAQAAMPFFRGMEGRVFEPEERNAALAWASRPID